VSVPKSGVLLFDTSTMTQVATFPFSQSREVGVRYDILEILDDPEPDRGGNRFNDGKCDRQGRLWAGTMGADDWLAPTGALYRFDPDGRITRMHDEIKCSNGIGWSPDGRVMYHTESFRYAIFAFDFDPNRGEISGRRLFVQLDPDAGGFPDGLTVDREGFVWSAQPVYGRIVRYDPDGVIDRISVSTRSSSPGLTGRRKRAWSRPSPISGASPNSRASTTSRMVIAMVCQPLDTSSPNTDARPAASLRCIGCGS